MNTQEEAKTMDAIEETLRTWDLAQALADWEGRSFPTAEARNSYAALIYLDLMAKQAARRTQ
jgi:hypothetical protein